MPKLETIRRSGLSVATSASSSMVALGKVGKRESETDGMSRTDDLSIFASAALRSAGRSTGMSCWWVIGSGWSVIAISSRASVRQLPPTM